jgi:hypothetical protein
MLPDLSFAPLHLHACSRGTVCICPFSTSFMLGPFSCIEILVPLMILPNSSVSCIQTFSCIILIASSSMTSWISRDTMAHVAFTEPVHTVYRIHCLYNYGPVTGPPLSIQPPFLPRLLHPTRLKPSSHRL